MPIASRDQLIAGIKPRVPYYKVGGTMEQAGVLHSLIFTAGVPGAAPVPTPGINGANVTVVSAGNAAGFVKSPSAIALQNIYLARVGGIANITTGCSWWDYLWWNSGLSVTTTPAQTITQPTLPPRDRNGGTNGQSVIPGILVSTATTNAAAIANTTISYTNSAGVAGRVGTMPAFPATAVAGTFVPFSLDVGDEGIRSIQSFSVGTSYVSGAIHLVCARLINEADFLANIPVVQDAFATAFERIYDDTCLAMHFDPTGTTGTTFKGGLNFAQG